MKWLSLARKVVLYALAATGAFCLVSMASVLGLADFMFAEERGEEVRTPDGKLVAVRHVTHGGFGTVFTTMILVEDSDGNSQLVYRNKDSDYVPPMRWLDNETLQVVIHCGRISHLSNPAAYMEGDKPIERFRVRFEYDQKSCENPEGDE